MQKIACREVRRILYPETIWMQVASSSPL